MKEALFGRRPIDADTYRLMSKDQKALAGPPICPECRVVLDMYGMLSPAVTPRFDHPDAPENLDPLDDCSLARRSNRLRWFGRDGQDRVRGVQIRESFFELEFLRQAYAFCLSRAGRGSLPLALFGSMIVRADRLGIWSYVGVERWCIPHILLLLADYRTSRNHAFHFSLVRVTRLGPVWERPFPVEIVKLFSNTGDAFRSMPGSPNPAPILATDVADTDTDWMGTGMTRTLASFR